MMNTMYGRRGIGLSFMSGCLIGGIAALLLAPYSGAQTRRNLLSFAEDVREKAGEAKDNATEVLDAVVKRGRHFLSA